MTNIDGPSVRRKNASLSWILSIALASMFLGTAHGAGGEPALTEYQVKALFLLNFAKYVDWPQEAFAQTNSPIVIGLYGEDKFGGALKATVEGKTVLGRPIVVRPIAKSDDAGKHHILFISNSDKKDQVEILAKVKTLPLLTVGEREQFLELGGIINFLMKDGKVRLEVDLEAARQANLRISSRLLNVADVVKGKPK